MFSVWPFKRRKLSGPRLTLVQIVVALILVVALLHPSTAAARHSKAAGGIGRGTCGTAAGVSTATAPSANLCAPGNTASAVTPSQGYWTWTCTKGSTTSCRAGINGACGDGATCLPACGRPPGCGGTYADTCGTAGACTEPACPELRGHNE